MSQMAALGILIEVLEFRRPRYLLLLAIALLLSYSGTGLMLLGGFVPMAAVRHPSARLPVVLVVVIIGLLVATGGIDLIAFTSRVGEFENVRASGFARFVSPFWLAKTFFETASLPALLLGSGPGTSKAFVASAWYTAFPGTWIKLLYEYGIIGSFTFVCYLAACFRRSMCPPLLLAAILFLYVFLGGELLSVPVLTLIMVFCTLNAPFLPPSGAAATNRYRPLSVAQAPNASGGGGS